MTKAFRLLVLIFLVTVMSCASDQEKARDFVDKGQTAYDAGQYSEALIQVKNAVKLAPKSLEATRLMAQIYLKQGDARQTFSTLLKIEQLAPEDLDNTARVASFYLLARNFEEAKKRVDQVLAKNPDHIQALFLRAGLLSRDPANRDRLREIYNRILTLDPNQTRANLALARILNGEKEFDKAEHQLLKARETDPDDETGYKNLFDFYMARKRIDDAKTVLTDLIARKPDQAAPYIFLGNFYQGAGDIDKAKEAFLNAVDREKNGVNALMRLARLLNSSGDPAQAGNYIQQALEKEPANDAVRIAYAEFEFNHNRFDKARELVNELLAKRPNFPQAKVLSGRLLVRDGKLDEAITIFKALAKDEPDAPSYPFLLGSALNDKGETEQALTALAKAVEKAPNYDPARLLMADIYFRRQDYELAEDSVRKVLKNRPNDYRANLIMGNVLTVKKEASKARDIYQQLILQLPDNPQAYYRLALLDRAEGQYDDAELNLKKALSLNASLMDVFSVLVSVYGIQHQYDKAILAIDAQMEKVGTSNSTVAAILFNLRGNMQLAKQDIGGGQKDLDRALEKDPRYVPPYITLAKIYGAQKNWDQVEKTYKDLNLNRPDQPLGHGLLGSLYEQQGKTDLAEAQYLEALSIDPTHMPAVNNLAYLYAQEGKELNKALDLARNAKEKLGQVPAIMDTLGWVYYKKELFDSAVSEFDACVKLAPKNPIFHYHLGLAYHKLGESQKAKASLQNALDLKKDFQGSQDARNILATL